MEIRVTSPSDQNRTEVTLPAVAGLDFAELALGAPVLVAGEFPAPDTTPVRSARVAAAAALARNLLRRSEVQSAIGVDKLL